MLKDKTLCQFLNIKVEADSPFRCYHGGNEVYYETSDGVWERREYNSRGYVTYYEDSYGAGWRYEYDSNGNETYCKRSDGSWYKKEYDLKGNQIYFEDSNGYIYDKRPKELTMDDIAEKFGIPVEQLKIKK